MKKNDLNYIFTFNIEILHFYYYIRMLLKHIVEQFYLFNKLS